MSAREPTRRTVLLGAASAFAGSALLAGTRRTAGAQAIEPVSCALVLAVDVSSSIDGEHWWLQRKGYADAFLHPEVIRAIGDTARGRIAVSYFEWAGAASQRVIVPWTVVASEEDGGAIADTLLNGGRPFEGSTGLGAALEASMAQLAGCPFTADQKVIDVSGDGASNDGPQPELKREDAARANIRVNGAGKVTLTNGIIATEPRRFFTIRAP